MRYTAALFCRLDYAKMERKRGTFGANDWRSRVIADLRIVYCPEMILRIRYLKLGGLHESDAKTVRYRSQTNLTCFLWIPLYGFRLTTISNSRYL